jgi:serine/threonine-protein kinase
VAGKYVIERIIGEGGFGVVAAARHLQLGQDVAIKYLLPTALKSPMVVERFVREARLAASIRSEHVVRIYDVATLDVGTPYIVMEYLDGSDLRTLLEDGPVPAHDAVDFVLQACEALAEAHKSGIVHRDLKPDNFFLALGPGGATCIKLLDFGISKVTLDHTDSGQVRHVTRETDKFGTPAYMSPEQLQASARVDTRADIWSLGVVLFELLTGKLPFVSNDFPQLCASILTAAPLTLLDAWPYAQPELEPIVARCLEKDPEKRFQNVGELAEALAPLGVESGRRVEHIRRVLSDASVGVKSRRLVAGPSSRAGARDREDVARALPPRTEEAVSRRAVTRLLPNARRSALAIALTAVVSASAGIALMTLRSETPRSLSLEDARRASGVAQPPAAPLGAAPSALAPPPVSVPVPVAPSADNVVPPGSASAQPARDRPIPPPGPARPPPGPARKVPPASTTKASPPTRHVAPAASFDPGGVVNPFQ